MVVDPSKLTKIDLFYILGGQLGLSGEEIEKYLREYEKIIKPHLEEYFKARTQPGYDMKSNPAYWPYRKKEIEIIKDILRSAKEEKERS